MKHKEEILSNLEQYCEEGRYEQVLQAINELSKEEKDAEVLGFLARALNNLERFEEAKAVLEQLRATEEDTYLWQYRMGYCLYYLSFEHNYNKIKEEILLDAANHFDSAITMGAPDYIAVDCETFTNLIDLELKKVYGFFDNASSGCGSGCGCGSFSFDENDMDFGCGSGCGCGSFSFDENDMDFGCGSGCGCGSFSFDENDMDFGCASSCSSGCASSCGCGSSAYLEEENQVPEVFVGFVLLDENKWDVSEYKENFLKDWGFEIAAEDEESEEGSSTNDENADQQEDSLTIVDIIDDVMLSVSLMPAPIPDGEAEECAKNNYMWPEAYEVSKSHKAHLMITVIGSKMPLLERGKLFTKLLASATHSKHTLGVYTCGVVFEPSFFYDFSMMIKQDLLPIYNWVWHGLYQSPKGISAYTYGMKSFGKDEIEILDTDLAPDALRDLLSNIVFYVLENNIVLHDGETIGFSEDEKLQITRGEGVSIPGQTIKISLS